jgi:hypothetical protein
MRPLQENKQVSRREAHVRHGHPFAVIEFYCGDGLMYPLFPPLPDHFCLLQNLLTIMIRIFPYLGNADTTNSFKLIFVSEGYLADEATKFYGDCLAFADNLIQMAPFNLSRITSCWLSIYTAFTPSGSSGPSIDTPATIDRTAFESTYMSATGALTFNQTKVNAFLDSLQFTDSFGTESFNAVVAKGEPVSAPAVSLVIILLPPLSGHPDGAEAENNPTDNDYYFVATTTDKLWHQVVIRGICQNIGLGDEFELDGATQLAPVVDPSVGSMLLPFNLFYSTTTPGTAQDCLQWLPLFSSTQRSGPITTHPKSGTPANPDYTLEDPPLFHPVIEYWEGGGGYWTQIYRSAQDCLMRRKIGFPQLPLREQPLSFCPACYHYLKNITR